FGGHRHPAGVRVRQAGRTSRASPDPWVMVMTQANDSRRRGCEGGQQATGAVHLAAPVKFDIRADSVARTGARYGELHATILSLALGGVVGRYGILLAIALGRYHAWIAALRDHELLHIVRALLRQDLIGRDALLRQFRTNGRAV